MPSIHIHIAVIFAINLLVCAQILFIPVYQGSSPIVSTSPTDTNITYNLNIDETDMKHRKVNYLELLKNRKKKQITWLDDFGYEESVQDQLIGTPSSYNTMMSDTQESCANCDCGLRFRYKIVGGVVTEKLEYPWVVALLYQKRFICGGSLINDRYVTTAAHCVHGFNHDNYAVRFHEFDLYTQNETKSFTLKIFKIVEHPKYNPSNFHKDVALLKLAKPLAMNSMEGPRPICLPLPASNFFAGVNAVAVGWGKTQQDGKNSAKLLKVTLPIILPSKCAANYKQIIPITKYMICAGFEKGGKSTCQGDSGGPLMAVQERRFRLIGITSFAAGCAIPNYPGVSVRVSELLPWIKANTKDACYCT